MTSPLAVFLRRQLIERDESVRQFSDRTGLNESGLHQILRGERQYVTDRTLDKIADGLGITPAEMAAAMGRSADLAPDEAEMLAIFRRVPGEQRPAAKSMLRGLAIEPTQRRSSGRTDPSSIRRKAAIRQLQGNRHDGDIPPSDSSLAKGYSRPGLLASISQFLSVRLLAPANAI